MIRAAAKNHPHVYVVVDPSDYPALLEHIASGPTHAVDDAMRKKLAWKAFQHCASYDSVVSEYLWSAIGAGAPPPERTVPMTLIEVRHRRCRWSRRCRCRTSCRCCCVCVCMFCMFVCLTALFADCFVR